MQYFLNVKNNEIISASNLPVVDVDVINIQVPEYTFNDYQRYPDKYSYKDEKIVVDLEKYAQKEREKISMLHMTKYDFYKYILKPNGINYSKLLQIISEDEDLCAAWDLCANVYRGDEFLNKLATQYGISQNDLDNIFMDKGVL